MLAYYVNCSVPEYLDMLFKNSTYIVTKLIPGFLPGFLSYFAIYLTRIDVSRQDENHGLKLLVKLLFDRKLETWNNAYLYFSLMLY